MIIKQMFFKPVDRPINGVVKADQADNATVLQELDEYVVTNELEKHFRAFFESYGTAHNDPSIASRVGVWISGFFGSGKSHFLKILSYILANQDAQDATGMNRSAIEFFDESKIRDATIRGDMDKAVHTPADVILFNIDSKASGADDGNKILNVFLSVFNEYLGFSANHAHVANMERHLTEKGVYGRFRDAFQTSSGMTWEKERDGYLFYQDNIEAALGEALSLSSGAAKKWFEEAEQNFSVSVEIFCQWVREYLQSKAPEHRILFLVDEVGQFIGSDTQLMLTLQTITENLGTICNGRAWIIVTSQADMDAALGNISSAEANDFSKIAGRFKTRLSLSSSNTDEVIQRRLLRKTETAAAELHKVYAEKGDILRNQLSFDRTGPTLKNFDGPDTFAKNYPFAPYHFQLVQKVFEEIRKVGASGAHLAYGERSMLDAFQIAGMAVAHKEVGALVPMHSFYSSIEGFLDPAVKKTVDNAGDNISLDDNDINVLRTLFMIRYVELIKGTLDNLVTLSIEQIDEDKITLRKRVEESVQRLERETLVTRSGDEFLFLTNEERDITRKIKAIDLASSDENKELGTLIFRDALLDRSKYRHSANSMDYGVSRYLDNHSIDGRHDNDLRFDVITPLDPDYPLYSEARCIGKSADGNGLAVLKLPDNPVFFEELRTWLKTHHYIRLNSDDSQPDVARILAERARENQQRKQRVSALLEEMLEIAPVYACGQKIELKGKQITAKMNDACQYLLENTFTKLSYLNVLSDNSSREISAVLSADDIGQMGMSLGDELDNPQAIGEVDQYINLRSGQDERTLVADLLERFSKRPYGWPEGEIILIIARLTAAGKISLQKAGGTLQPRDAIEPLQNTRGRREVSIIRKRQTDEGRVKAALEFSKELFAALGPSTEKELFDFYCRELSQRLNNLNSYKSQAEAGGFPGLTTIESSQLKIQRLLSNTDSYDFFAALLDNKSQWLDLEEDYMDLRGFYSNQIQSWKEMQGALLIYSPNKTALSRDPMVSEAFTQLEQIKDNPTPFGQLNKIANFITTIKSANEVEVTARREHATSKIDERIAQIQSELERSGLQSADLSNRLLLPLQQTKKAVSNELSIAEIYRLQTQVAEEKQDDALNLLEREQRAQANAGADKDTPTKQIVEMSTASLVQNHVEGIYIETEEDAEALVKALRQSLLDAIAANKRVRIR